MYCTPSAHRHSLSAAFFTVITVTVVAVVDVVRRLSLQFVRSFVPSLLPLFVPSFLRSFLCSFVPSFVRLFVPSFVPFFVASSFLRSFVPPFAIQCADCYCCAARYLCAFCCTCVTIVLLVVRRSFVRLLCPCVARHSLPSC